MTERDKLEQIAEGKGCNSWGCGECPISTECATFRGGPTDKLTAEHAAAARAKLAEMDAEGVHSVPPSMRELLKEAIEVLIRGQGDEQTNLAQRIKDYLALSAPDESAIEKVRKIREGALPGHTLSSHYFNITDSEAAALIQPSVPRKVLCEVYDRGYQAGLCDKTQDYDFSEIAAKHGVKVG